MGSDLTAEQELAFDEWRALAIRAAETKAVADCVASGNAFAKFHYLFVERDLRGGFIPLSSGASSR